MQSLKVGCATCGARHLVLMVWVAGPWASHVSAVSELCWLPGRNGNFPQLHSQVFLIRRKDAREIWCPAKSRSSQALRNGGNRSQVDVSLLQVCALEAQWLLSWLETTALHSDTNSHCLFMTTQVLLIFMLENESHLQRTRVFSRRFQMIDNCGTMIFPFFFFFLTDCFLHSFVHVD